MTIFKAITLLSLALFVSGVPLSQPEKGGIGESDQLVSGSTVAKSVVPDSQAAATNLAKGDLKTSDSFGFGYYLPIVAPALVKYHYPLIYYPTYLHSIRHHGYGGYGFYQHGHGVIH